MDWNSGSYFIVHADPIPIRIFCQYRQPFRSIRSDTTTLLHSTVCLISYSSPFFCTLLKSSSASSLHPSLKTRSTTFVLHPFHHHPSSSSFFYLAPSHLFFSHQPTFASPHPLPLVSFCNVSFIFQSPQT